MKPRPFLGPGRLRRPGRGNALLEFVIGLAAGILASWIISFAFDSSSPTTQPDARVPLERSGDLKQDVNPEAFELPIKEKVVVRDALWQPKPRLPGHKTPTIACMVTQHSDKNIMPAVINATWGARCDRLIFTSPRMGMSEEELERFEHVPITKEGTKDTSWGVYRDFLRNVPIKDSDYFIVVNDITYAVPDNVRYEFRSPNPGEAPLFWGRKISKGLDWFGSQDSCVADFFVLSRSTLIALQTAFKESQFSACNDQKANDAAGPRISACLAAIGVPCKPAVDFENKEQVMYDPVQLLSKSDVPAHLYKGSDCCSVLPLAFINVGKTISIRTGTFSYHYFYDYFIRDTAVYGREYMRPLNGIDAGVGKPQIGF